jgi:hypothetical protein
MYDYPYLLHDDADVGHGGSEYSANEVDFGRSDPDLNKGHGSFGLHFVVTEAFNNLTSLIVHIVAGAATAPTTSIISRTIAVAGLTLGKHYFIPAPPTLARYARAYFELSGGSNPTAGEATAYFGPKTGGEL